MPRPRRLDVAKIRQASAAKALSREIRTCFTTRVDGEVSNQWPSLQTSVYGAAEKILGYIQRRRSDWISGRTLQLSAQTARARSRNDEYFRQLREMTAKSARDDRKQYWAEIATSMEQTSNVGDTPQRSFLPLLPMQCHATPPPSEGDVADAIRKLRNNKAPGRDGIPAEIYKSSVDMLAPWLHEELSVTALDPAPLPHWKRRRGGQFKTWLDRVRQDMEVVLGLSVFGLRRWRKEWVELSRSAAADSHAWRGAVRDIEAG
nr:unnamed protein product [Spirometra erinaceieuropaei]